MTRTDNTGPTCTCGHAEGQHSRNSTHPCLACVKCDRPGHDPHAAERCRCASFTPAASGCEICGQPTENGAATCAKCTPVVPANIGGNPR
jgi:hypothetical protein